MLVNSNAVSPEFIWGIFKASPVYELGVSVNPVKVVELAEIEAEADNMNMLKDFEQEVLDFPEIYNVFQ